MATQERLKRNKDTQEFFTPDWAVKMMVDEVPEEFFKNLEPFQESGCGNGNIAIQIYEKYKLYHDHESIMNVFRLADIMEDNCKECIVRLYGPGKIEVLAGKRIPIDMVSPGLIACFKFNGTLIKSVVQADCTKYLFGEPETFGHGLFAVAG
jgi:hypothetical protein